jgi:ABC-2 type transport system ATP-binding protein
MSEHLIEMTELRKAYGNSRALDGLSLRVERGSVYGFLGRNGAGKTTTIKVLMGLLRADSGEARIFGETVGGKKAIDIRRRIGFVTEDKELYPYWTVQEMIGFTRSFYPKWRDDIEKKCSDMFRLPYCAN